MFSAFEFSCTRNIRAAYLRCQFPAHTENTHWFKKGVSVTLFFFQICSAMKKVFWKFTGNFLFQIYYNLGTCLRTDWEYILVHFWNTCVFAKVFKKNSKVCLKNCVLRSILKTFFKRCASKCSKKVTKSVPKSILKSV